MQKNISPKNVYNYRKSNINYYNSNLYKCTCYQPFKVEQVIGVINRNQMHLIPKISHELNWPTLAT